MKKQHSKDKPHELLLRRVSSKNQQPKCPSCSLPFIPCIEPLHKRAAKIPATTPSPRAGWIIPAAALAGAEVVPAAAAAVLLERATLTVLSEALRTVVLEPTGAVMNPEALTGAGTIGAAVVTGTGMPGEPDTKEAAAV